MQHNWRRGLQPKGTSANSHRSEPFLDQTRITHTRNGTRRVCRDGYRFRSPPRRKLRRSFFPAGLNEDFIGHCFPIKEFHFSYSKAGFRAAAGFDARNFFHWPAERHRRGLVFPGITPLAGDRSLNPNVQRGLCAETDTMRLRIGFRPTFSRSSFRLRQLIELDFRVQSASFRANRGVGANKEKRVRKSKRRRKQCSKLYPINTFFTNCVPGPLSREESNKGEPVAAAVCRASLS